MIDFTEEHEQFRSSVQRFIASEINPHVDAWEAAGRFPAHEVFRKMGELGFLGVYKPERWGGAGLDFITYQFNWLLQFAGSDLFKKNKINAHAN